MLRNERRGKDLSLRGAAVSNHKMTINHAETRRRGGMIVAGKIKHSATPSG
jgi:hypothetical protein